MDSIYGSEMRTGGPSRKSTALCDSRILDSSVGQMFSLSISPDISTSRFPRYFSFVPVQGSGNRECPPNFLGALSHDLCIQIQSPTYRSKRGMAAWFTTVGFALFLNN